MHKFTNEKLGIEVTVDKVIGNSYGREGQFVVKLRDTDTDEIFPQFIFYQDKTEAVKYAEKIANT